MVDQTGNDPGKRGAVPVWGERGNRSAPIEPLECWYRERPDLFRKRPENLPGLDTRVVEGPKLQITSRRRHKANSGGQARRCRRVKVAVVADMPTTVDTLPTIVYAPPMFEIIASKTFTTWLQGLRDQRAVARINARLRRVSTGNLGDVVSVGEGVSEMRIFYGPGYRLYFIRQGVALIVLLCGGDKSTQAHDIEHAKALAQEWEG
jgi:putative addiction module killer protein